MTTSHSCFCQYFHYKQGIWCTHISQFISPHGKMALAYPVTSCATKMLIYPLLELIWGNVFIFALMLHSSNFTQAVIILMLFVYYIISSSIYVLDTYELLGTVSAFCQLPFFFDCSRGYLTQVAINRNYQSPKLLLRR